jgi:hypothetical protein
VLPHELGERGPQAQKQNLYIPSNICRFAVLQALMKLFPDPLLNVSLGALIAFCVFAS